MPIENTGTLTQCLLIQDSEDGASNYITWISDKHKIGATICVEGMDGEWVVKKKFHKGLTQKK